MGFARQSKVIACLMLAVGAAHAAPVSYQFTTDALTLGPTNPVPVIGASSTEIFNALKGLSVSGSFTQDSGVPLVTTTNGPTVINQANYFSAVSNLSGAAGAFSFTSATGGANVANEGQPLGLAPNPITYQDFLQLGAPGNSGITLNGLSLLSARLFWIEGDGIALGTPDFLTDNALPDTLPGFRGRLALDFAGTNAAGHARSGDAGWCGVVRDAAPARGAQIPGMNIR